MFWARLGKHGCWPSGLRCRGLEQHEKPGNVLSFVALGPPSGVVAALAEHEDAIGFLLQSSATVSGFGCFSPVTAVAAAAAAAVAAALGGGGGIMKDDISSDVSTALVRFSSGLLPLVCGGGGMVIVAKNDSRSRFIRVGLFLNPWSSTESTR